MLLHCRQMTASGLYVVHPSLSLMDNIIIIIIIMYKTRVKKDNGEDTRGDKGEDTRAALEGKISKGT